MSNHTSQIEQATALLSAVAALDWKCLTDDEACALVGRLGAAQRMLSTAAALGAAEIADRSRFELGSAGLSYKLGQRRPVALIEELTLCSQREASAQIRLGSVIAKRVGLLGEALPPSRPYVAAAMLAGSMSGEAAASVVHCLEQAERNHAPLEDVDYAESSLVDFATQNSADLVAVQAKAWREWLDPDGAEPREEEIRARRGARLGRERNGISRLTVDCDPLLAANLRAAFGAAGAPGKEPVFLSAEERQRGITTVETPDGEIVETFIDPRTREQLNHDIVLGLVTAGLRSTGRAAGELRQTVTVMATVTLQDLLNGTGHGFIDDTGEPMSIETIRSLVCEGGFESVVTGDTGNILFLGRQVRYFTQAQKRALSVRDGGCVWPQCQAPPGWCDAHHVREVEADAGPTNIDNGVLLCPAHHHMLHHSAYTMRMIDGRPHLLAPEYIDPSQNWRLLGRSRVLMGVGR